MDLRSVQHAVTTVATSADLRVFLELNKIQISQPSDVHEVAASVHNLP